MEGVAAARDLLHRRPALFRRQPAQGPGWRLVPAADRRGRLHAC